MAEIIACVNRRAELGLRHPATNIRGRDWRAGLVTRTVRLCSAGRLAAKRRKIVAHGVSHGFKARDTVSPGRSERTFCFLGCNSVAPAGVPIRIRGANRGPTAYAGDHNLSAPAGPRWKSPRHQGRVMTICGLLALLGLRPRATVWLSIGERFSELANRSVGRHDTLLVSWQPVPSASGHSPRRLSAPPMNLAPVRIVPPSSTKFSAAFAPVFTSP